MSNVSIVIQRQEDHPHNPGWWRYSRPRCEVHTETPPLFSNSIRWYCGSEADAERDAAEWDRQHPNG
jgi:hypothetical protein